MAEEYKFLITGYGRSGTGYMAAWFGYMGYDIGHERFKKDGISAWQFAVPDAKCGAGAREGKTFKHVIHVVRNPWKVLRSNLYRRNIKPTYNFCKKWGDIEREGELESEMRSVVIWNRLAAEQNPDLTVRVEDVPEKVPEWMKANGIPVNYKVGPPNKEVNKCNTEMKPLPGEILKGVGGESAEMFKAHCELYGYPVEQDG